MLKKFVLFSAIASCSVSLVSCGNSQGYIAQKATASETPSAKVVANISKPTNIKAIENIDQSTSEIAPSISEKATPNRVKNSSKDFPEIATVRQLRRENSGCTLTLEDKNGDVFSVGTSLSMCQNQAAFLDKRVRVVYEEGSRGVVVTSLEIIAQSIPQSPIQSDSHTMTNGEWTFTLWNMNAWSGVNNTGDAIYHGCDSRGNCIDLDQGKTSCRDGICSTGWQNGDYFYIVESTITERPEDSQTTLIVRNGDTEVMRETGFWVVLE